jgi:hypothetical protein
VINLGAFVLTSDLRANLNGSSRQNPEVDFDEAFGSSHDASRVRADVLWRIAPAHNMRFMYFSNTKNRSQRISEVLEWGDITYDVGAEVDFRYRMEIYELVYEYAFLRRPTYEIAASAGVHFTDMTLQLSGTATVTDPDGGTRTESAASKTSSLPAPLPVLGLRAGWVVSPSWYLDAQIQYFRASYDGFDGYWSDIKLGATWMYNRNVGIGDRLQPVRHPADGRARLVRRPPAHRLLRLAREPDGELLRRMLP